MNRLNFLVVAILFMGLSANAQTEVLEVKNSSDQTVMSLDEMNVLKLADGAKFQIGSGYIRYQSNDWEWSSDGTNWISLTSPEGVAYLTKQNIFEYDQTIQGDLTLNDPVNSSTLVIRTSSDAIEVENQAGALGGEIGLIGDDDEHFSVDAMRGDLYLEASGVIMCSEDFCTADDIQFWSSLSTSPMLLWKVYESSDRLRFRPYNDGTSALFDCVLEADAFNTAKSSKKSSDQEVVRNNSAVTFQTGKGQLKKGYAEIVFPEIFTEFVNLENIHVDFTIVGKEDCNQLRIVEVTSSGFIVKEMYKGTSNASFSYKVTTIEDDYLKYQDKQKDEKDED